MMKSGGKGGSLSGSGYFRDAVKSGGRGASSTELFETLEDADVSPGPYTALLVESGGRGGSGSGDLALVKGGLATAVFSEGAAEGLGAWLSAFLFPSSENGDLLVSVEPNGDWFCV
jgi:hypothetical protein